MDKSAKFRHEFKYLCSMGQIQILQSRIRNLMPLDPHVQGGQYTIRSLYFDNISNRCYYENENGTDPREKFRIRIYNGSSDRIQLECKRKERGKTHKVSCTLTREQFDGIMDNCNLEVHPDNHPLLNKFIILCKAERYAPSVIVEYNRIPYVYRHGNVRVTFDMNIRSSDQFHRFLEPELDARPILPAGHHLVEVKYDELLPGFIHDSLQIADLQQSTFSKYYLCKKYSFGGIL